MDTAQPPIATLPVQTITGFLGAGKTTLIQRLLASRPAGLRVAVVVNEFGRLPFDGAMLRESSTAPGGGGGAIYDLPGGCLCCTQAAQLGEMLERIAERSSAGSPGFDRVLIEASGAATADGIVLTLFALPPHANRLPLELAPTVVVVDCETILKRLTWDIYVLKQQLQVADVVVLNRSAGLSAERRTEIEAAIREYAPVAPLVPEPSAEAAWTAICRPRFAVAQSEREPNHGHRHSHPHEHKHEHAHAHKLEYDHSHPAAAHHALHAGMEQLELTLPAGVPVAALAQVIESWTQNPAVGQVLRAKGFAHAGADEGTGVGVRALELAGGRVFQRKMSAVVGCETGRLVVIGRNLQRAVLENSLVAAANAPPD